MKIFLTKRAVVTAALRAFVRCPGSRQPERWLVVPVMTGTLGQRPGCPERRSRSTVLIYPLHNFDPIYAVDPGLAVDYLAHSTTK